MWRSNLGWSGLLLLRSSMSCAASINRLVLLINGLRRSCLVLHRWMSLRLSINVASTCGSWTKKTCVMYMVSTYRDTYLLHAPNWKDCSNSNVSRIRNVNITIKLTDTYVLCTNDMKHVDLISKSSICVNLHAFGGTLSFSTYISIEFIPGCNLSIVRV